MPSKLTQKQERFCTEYLQCGNASEAYRASYSTSRMKPETIHRAACRVMSLSNVCTRIDELRAASCEIAVLTAAGVISDLLKVKDHSMTLDDKGMMLRPDTAVRSLELLGKNLGMWAPDTMIAVQVNNEGRESFEAVLSRAIYINGGFPDFEAKKQQAIGELYQRWSKGETIEENPVIGGLNDPFSVGEYTIEHSGPLPEDLEITGGGEHGFILTPEKSGSMEEWTQIAERQKK